MERYELVRDIGSGNFGVARLMRDRDTKELVAVKCIPRGLKSSLLHSRPKSTVGTPAYIAPEVVSRREYDGRQGYPFEDPNDPNNFRKTIVKIMMVDYKIPEHVHITEDCRQLLSRIFIANPTKRITMREIKNHPWFLKNLPRELRETAQAVYFKNDDTAPTVSLQSIDEIMEIVKQARIPPPSCTPVPGFAEEVEVEEGLESKKEKEEGPLDTKEKEEEEEDDEYDKRVKEVHASGEYLIS